MPWWGQQYCIYINLEMCSLLTQQNVQWQQKKKERKKKKTELLTSEWWFSNNSFGWSRTGIREQKNTSNVWPKNGHRHLKNLSSGRLRESFWNSIWLRNKTVICKVVAYEKRSLEESWLYKNLTGDFLFRESKSRSKNGNLNQTASGVIWF